MEPIAREGQRATVAEWLSLPEELGAELIDGRIVYKAEPYVEHGSAQGAVFSQVFPMQLQGSGPGGPG